MNYLLQYLNIFNSFGNIDALATDLSDNMVEILILGFQDRREEEEAEDEDDILSSTNQRATQYLPKNNEKINETNA